MIDHITEETNNKMQLCIKKFEQIINNIRTGRASPKLLNGIYVEYFGSKTSLPHLSNITVENSHTLKVHAFDESNNNSICKSILHSDLDLNPVIKGRDIIVPIPSMTEERRKKLVKLIKSNAEKSRIYIRNIRRDTNDKIKNLLKQKTISKDQEHGFQSEIQIMTNKNIQKIDMILSKKEKELMHF